MLTRFLLGKMWSEKSLVLDRLWPLVSHHVHLAHSLIQDLTHAFVLIKHLMSELFVLHFSYLVLKSHLWHELVLVWADQSVSNISVWS